jgi:hypothetical protein
MLSPGALGAQYRDTASVPRRAALTALLRPQSLTLALSCAAQDVLAICGGTLPAWTGRLVFGARFLFPFPLRRAWFRATALGLPRALAHLQVCHL